MKDDSYKELKNLYDRQFEQMMSSMRMVARLTSKLTALLTPEEVTIEVDPNDKTESMVFKLDKQDIFTLTHKQEDGYQYPTVIFTVRRKDEK